MSLNDETETKTENVRVSMTRLRLKNLSLETRPGKRCKIPRLSLITAFPISREENEDEE